jgi:hypothetical protein
MCADRYTQTSIAVKLVRAIANDYPSVSQKFEQPAGILTPYQDEVPFGGKHLSHTGDIRERSNHPLPLSQYHSDLLRVARGISQSL